MHHGVQVAIVAIIVALSTFAEAAPAAAPPAPLDEGTATLLSGAGTVVPLLAVGATIALVADSSELTPQTAALGIVSGAGLYLLPSAGHWYSGKSFTRGFAIRTAGMVIAGLGVVKAIEGAGCHCFCDDSNSDLWFMGIGAAVVLGGAVDDVVTAGPRARSVNAQMQPTITPVPMPGGGGVSVLLRF